MSIARLDADDFHTSVPGLAEVLADAVDGGASLGFLAPLDPDSAARWWRTRAAEVAQGSLAVWVCRDGDRIVGTISLAFVGKANAQHRAEIAKLIVHRDARGRGRARDLLTAAERAAQEAGVTLLVLDTQTASDAEYLYLATGWTRFGVVPDYAADPAGSLKDCTFFYKRLSTSDSTQPAPMEPPDPARRS